MPIHDWTRVEAGIFHAFHHRWISAICDSLNDGLLPPEYYALAEQHAAGLGPDVLTLQELIEGDATKPFPSDPRGSGVGVVTEPQIRDRAETSSEFYHRKKNRIVVRHESDDRVIATLELERPLGDTLIDMPLFLEPGMHILIPMEKTYQIAWASVPRRWRRVIDPSDAT